MDCPYLFYDIDFLWKLRLEECFLGWSAGNFRNDQKFYENSKNKSTHDHQGLEINSAFKFFMRGFFILIFFWSFFKKTQSQHPFSAI